MPTPVTIMCKGNRKIEAAIVGAHATRNRDGCVRMRYYLLLAKYFLPAGCNTLNVNAR